MRVDEDAKSRLEELQAAVQVRTGADVSRTELLATIIADAYESPDDVVQAFRDATVPLSEEQKETMRRGRISSGVETDEEDVDDAIY